MNASRLSHPCQLMSQTCTAPDSLPEAAEKRSVLICGAHCRSLGRIGRLWARKHGSLGGGWRLPSVAPCTPLGVCPPCRALWAWMWCVAHSAACDLPSQASLSEAELLSLDGNLPSSAGQSCAVPSSIPRYLPTEAGSRGCLLVTAPQPRIAGPSSGPSSPHPPFTPPCLLRTPLLQSWESSLRALPVRFSLSASSPVLPLGPLWSNPSSWETVLIELLFRIFRDQPWWPAASGPRLSLFQPPSVLSRLTSAPRQLLALPRGLGAWSRPAASVGSGLSLDTQVRDRQPRVTRPGRPPCILEPRVLSSVDALPGVSSLHPGPASHPLCGPDTYAQMAVS